MQHRSLVLGFALALAGASPVAAAQPAAVPAPAATPAAFSARAHATLTVTTQTGTYDATAQIAVAQRERFTRYDILSIRSTAFPVPTTALTFVLDRVARTVTIWNAATKTSYTQSVVPSLPGTAPGSLPATPLPPAGRSPLADLEVFSFTMALAGHAVTAGLPSTGLTFAMDIKPKSAPAVAHVTATTQLADEFAGFPLSIDAHVDPGTPAFAGRFAYLVDDFERRVPASTDFLVPPGYARADSLLTVLLGRPVVTP